MDLYILVKNYYQTVANFSLAVKRSTRSAGAMASEENRCEKS